MKYALIDIHMARERQRKVNRAAQAGSVAWTFGAMLTGLIHPAGEGGFGGLKAPMSYSTFIFFFIITPLLAVIALWH